MPMTLKIIDRVGEEKAGYNIDAVSLKREIADRITDLEAYPLQDIQTGM